MLYRKHTYTYCIDPIIGNISLYKFYPLSIYIFIRLHIYQLVFFKMHFLFKWTPSVIAAFNFTLPGNYLYNIAHDKSVQGLTILYGTSR